MEPPHSQINHRQNLFVKNISTGKLTKEESALKAGYSAKSASSIASQLLRKTKIIKALEEIGITDKFIARNLKQHISDGLGVKATADTSLRALDLATKLKGYQEADRQPQSLTQNNISIELKASTDEELELKLNSLLQDIEEIKTR